MLTRADFPDDILRFAEAFGAAGGRAIIVGGVVRDLLLAQESKDYDLEIFGLRLDDVEAVLAEFGEVIAVGRAFGVLRVKGHDIDFSVPRRDSKVGKGHTGFRIDCDPFMDFKQAARRRDLTVNSIGVDPLTGELLDPFGGRADLERRVLRATDSATFPEDPLRALRVAQFRARLEAEPDAELVELCAGQDLADLPGERFWQEFTKLLLKARRPSLGLDFLEQSRLLRFFPELAAIVDVPQDPEWHPEGSVWVHTLMVVDEAAKLRTGDEDHDLALLYGALCHDLGKATTTVHCEDGRIRSPNHEPEGVPLAESFLQRLRAPNVLVDKVAVLVRYHLSPAHFVAQRTTAKGYRRLARRLGEAGATLELLEQTARADHFGRTTPDALAREFPAGDVFLETARELAVELAPTSDVVLGRHVLARGWKPGPHVGEILRRCRQIQDDTGWDDPDDILDRAIAEAPPRRPAESGDVDSGEAP